MTYEDKTGLETTIQGLYDQLARGLQALSVTSTDPHFHRKLALARTNAEQSNLWATSAMSSIPVEREHDDNA